MNFCFVELCNKINQQKFSLCQSLIKLINKKLLAVRCFSKISILLGVADDKTTWMLRFEYMFSKIIEMIVMISTRNWARSCIDETRVPRRTVVKRIIKISMLLEACKKEKKWYCVETKKMSAKHYSGMFLVVGSSTFLVSIFPDQMLSYLNPWMTLILEHSIKTLFICQIA